MMNVKLWHLLIPAIAAILSCDDSFVLVKCPECLDYEPKDAKITLEIENFGEYTIKLIIFEGDVEGNIILGSYINPAKQTEYYLAINKKYTFQVEYTDREGIKYVALDSVFPRVKLELEQCSVTPCYYVYDNKLNMRLKYH